MATTAHDDGFHEIQLNGKQLVFLFMAGTVVAVVIFLLGVFVGRGVSAQVGPSDPTLLAESGAATDPDVPPIAASTGGGPPATAAEDLSYADRLGGTPPKETLSAEPTAPDARSESSAPNARSAPRTPDASGARIAPDAPSAPDAHSARSTPSAVATPNVPTEPAGDGFAIQLAALGKRDEAEGIVRRLADKGYSAYLIAPSAGAPQVYRVRVGKFKDRRQAESVSARLQKEEQFKPWIVR